MPTREKRTVEDDEEETQVEDECGKEKGQEEDEEKGADDNSASENASEDDTPRRKRSRNWAWNEQWALIKLVEKHGKNWEKVTEELKNQHILPNIDKKKVMKQWHQLAGKTSCLRKPHRTPELRWHDLEGLSPKEKRNKLREHEAYHQKVRQQKEEAWAIIQRVNKEERILASSTNASEKEVIDKLQSAEQDRKRKREELLKKYEDDAREEKEFRKAATELFKVLAQSLGPSETEKLLQVYLQLRISEMTDARASKRRRVEDTDV
jgi:hypothetical protein